MSTFQPQDVSLNALRVFATLARCGSFRQAAAELNVSQPAISRQLTRLEHQLGVQLVQRDNRMHALTPAGQQLAGTAQQSFRQLDRALVQVREQRQYTRRVVRLALADELLTFWLGPQLQRFQELYPHLELACATAPEAVTAGNQQTVTQLLLQYQCDVLLSFGAPGHKQLAAQPLRHSTLHAIHYHDNAVTEQPLINADFISSGRPGSTTRPCERTAMAISQARYNQEAAWVPDIYLPALKQEGCQQQSQTPLAAPDLVASCRYQSQQELAVVALLNWLQYLTAGQR